MKISKRLGVNLGIVEKIPKELDESNGDYEGMTVLKPHSDRSDNKTTLEYLGEIQAMIDNDPSKSIRSTLRDMEMSEFLIR